MKEVEVQDVGPHHKSREVFRSSRETSDLWVLDFLFNGRGCTNGDLTESYRSSLNLYISGNVL